MGGFEWLLEVGLAGLLAATLFHALRLERALGVLKRDRAALERLVAGFNDSTRQAEAGVAQLRAAADDAGRRIARQIDAADALKDDLGFLIGRAEHAADRLDAAVRAARPMPHAQHIPAHAHGATSASALAPAVADDDGAPALPRLRSQAERDLMQALRLAR